MPSLHSKEPIVSIIIQARMGSTRFPGKVLEMVVGDTSLLGFLLQRLRKCRKANALIVATSISPKDDILAKWLAARDNPFIRGSETDCLGRLAQAARSVSADVIVRITADCPLVLPEVVDAMIAYFLDNRGEIDYLSNRQYTNFPEGLDVEVFSMRLLNEATEKALERKEREHVNYYFLNRPQSFRIRYFCHDLGLDYSRFKLSVDTEDDLERIRSLFACHKLPLEFSFSELMAVLRDCEAGQRREESAHAN